MDNVLQVLNTTPLYVLMISFFMLYTGYVHKKDREVMVHNLFVLSVLALGLSVKGVVGLESSIIYVLTLSVGYLVGFLNCRTKSFNINKSRLAVLVPGTPLTFVLVLVYLTAFFFFDLVNDVSLSLSYGVLKMVLPAFVSGVFLGNAVFYQKKFDAHHAPINKVKHKSKAKDKQSVSNSPVPSPAQKNHQPLPQTP